MVERRATLSIGRKKHDDFSLCCACFVFFTAHAPFRSPRFAVDLLPWTPHYRCHLPVCTHPSCRNHRPLSSSIPCSRTPPSTFPLFSTLFKLGLSSASEVFLTGCSAGGLATYLHAGRADCDLFDDAKGLPATPHAHSLVPPPTRPSDYVGSILQNVTTLTKFKAASISGFFLLHNTVEGVAPRRSCVIPH